MDEELFNPEEDSRSTNTGSSEEAGKGHRRSWSFGSINGNYFSFEYLFQNKVISLVLKVLSVLSGVYNLHQLKSEGDMLYSVRKDYRSYNRYRRSSGRSSR